MSIIKTTGKALIPFFIAILACFIANSSLNWHFHKLPTGIVVEHAHPYQKSKSGVPFQNHNHNSFEFFFLSQISIAVFTFTILVFIFSNLIFSTGFKKIPIRILYHETDLYFLNNYHAPPISH